MPIYIYVREIEFSSEGSKTKYWIVQNVYEIHCVQLYA